VSIFDVATYAVGKFLCKLPNSLFNTGVQKVFSP